MTETSPAAPLRLSTAHEPELVVHGLRRLAAEHADRVVVLPSGPAGAPSPEADLVLHDSLAAPPCSLMGLEQLVATPGMPAVVTFTWNPRPDLVRRAMDRGAAGCLAKDLPVDRLLSALTSIHAGRQVVDTGRDELSPDLYDMVVPLTPREEEVLILITRGLDNNSVARATYLSINSVKSHIRSAYRKMGVTSRSQAVLWGIRHGYGTADPSEEAPTVPLLTG